MHKSVRQYARADIELPPGWSGENTAIKFTVEVQRTDTLERLSQDNIDVETTDYDEEDVPDDTADKAS